MIKPALLASCLCVVVGCGDDAASPISTGPVVLVQYQSEPLADVHVRLLSSASGPVLTQAITQRNGQAIFVDLPSPEPEAYFVSLESVGDGGWILNPKITDRAIAPLRLKPLTDNPLQSIQLPPGSVQPLHPSKR